MPASVTQKEFDALAKRVGVTESRITALEARVAESEEFPLRLDAVEASVASLDSRVAVLESNVPPPRVQVATVEIRPESLDMLIDETRLLSATVKDAAGNTLDRPVVWKSSDPTIAFVLEQPSIIEGLATAVATAVGEGSITISAVCEGVVSNMAFLLAQRTRPVFAIECVPQLASLTPDQTLQLVTVITDKHGNLLVDRSVSFSSADPGIATVDALTGLVTGVAAGSTTITATSEGKSYFVPAIVTSGGGGDEDLVITSTYVQTHHDQIPRFGNVTGSTIITSAQSGNWNATSTWTGGVVPSTDSRSQVLASHTVTYNLNSSVKLDCCEVSGTLTFDPAATTKMVIDDLMIMPSGTLNMQPNSASIVHEVVIRGDTALKTGTVGSPGIDPKQYGKGLICYGTCNITGATRTSHLRLAVEPLIGHTTLTLVSPPTGWAAGDTVIIPDTRQIRFAGNERNSSERYFVSQSEERTIASVSGAVVTLTAALTYDHKGPRDADGNQGAKEIAMMPHVANLTRNVIIRSEDQTTILRRGHGIFLYRAAISLKYAEFRGLGRTLASQAATDNSTFDANGNLTYVGTNQIGKYSIHLHHLYGPVNPGNTGYQLEVTGCVINNFAKWGLTLHDTHYGLVQHNVCYDGIRNTQDFLGWGGSAIATEEGNESYNLIDSNFVCHSKAGSDQYLRAAPGIGGTSSQEGVSRDGFWLRGPNNHLNNNVACNCPDLCFNFNGGVNHDYGVVSVPRVPNFRGANMHEEDEYTQVMTPLLEATGNEAYGASGQGLWLSHIQGKQESDNGNYDRGPSVFLNWRAWHCSEFCVNDWGDNTGHTFKGWICRGDKTKVDATSFASMGMSFGESYYRNVDNIVEEFDIQGFTIGIELPFRPYIDANIDNDPLVDTGFLKNHINIECRYPHYTDQHHLIKDVEAELITAHGGFIWLYLQAVPATPCNVWMHPDNNDSHAFLTNITEIILQNWQLGGINYKLYFLEARPDALVPSYRVGRGALPQEGALCYEQGLTNQQCWDTYGGGVNNVNKPVGGTLPPCNNSACDNGLALAATLGVLGLAFEV